MTQSEGSGDIVAAVTPVVVALESLGVAYRIGGSVASSALGVPRSTLDVDLVCELPSSRVDAFVAALEADFYVDGDMIRDAIDRRASFNLVHLATMVKIDVFLRKERPWDVAAFARTLRRPLEGSPGARDFDLTTAEDIILHKLDWYRLGNEISERQWKDVLGVVAVQRPVLDMAYLERWAKALGLEVLWARALAEAPSI